MTEDKTKEKSYFPRGETAEGRNPIKSDYIRLCADCWLSRVATFLLQYNTDRQTGSLADLQPRPVCLSSKK